MTKAKEQRVRLNKVGQVEIVNLMDNFTDRILTEKKGVKRFPAWKKGAFCPGPIAEHGYSALVRVSVDGRQHAVLFDTGTSSAGVVQNAKLMGVRLGEAEAIVLSHGHPDHSIGLVEVLKAMPERRRVVVFHPDALLKRYRRIPSGELMRLPGVSQAALRRLKAKLLKTKEPSLLAGNAILVTGEVPRRTSYEKGFPSMMAEIGGKIVDDPLIRDDQSIILEVKGKGLVVIAGCAHAGIVNTLRYAQELTGVRRIHAVLGGFHLSGKQGALALEPTIRDLKKLAPKVVIPSHCTGWDAINRIQRAMRKEFVLASVGTIYTF